MEYNHSQNSFDLVAKILSWQTLMSFAIAIGLLTLVITKVDIDWTNTKDTIFKSNIPVYLLAFISYYFGFLLRGWRWSIMIKNSDRSQNLETKDYSIFQCSLYVYLGWFANTVTWFRLGDVYRAYIFSQDNKDSFPRVIGTILSERILDIATVLFVLVLAFWLYIVLYFRCIPFFHFFIMDVHLKNMRCNPYVHVFIMDAHRQKIR